MGRHKNPRSCRPVLYRIADRVALTDSGCLVWLGSINPYGYGQVQVGRRGEGVRQVHRVLYEKVHGPVPAGMELDHLCRNRVCCHPDHLEPVTRLENILRGIAARRAERGAA